MVAVLVKAGFGFETVMSWDENELTLWYIRNGMAEGREWDWKRGRWARQR